MEPELVVDNVHLSEQCKVLSVPIYTVYCTLTWTLSGPTVSSNTK